jgi:hypothetical protein
MWWPKIIILIDEHYDRYIYCPELLAKKIVNLGSYVEFGCALRNDGNFTKQYKISIL